MSQKKIADLTEVQSVDENLCYVPVDNGSATVKIKLKNLEESATESAESYAQAAAASATSASGYADAAALSSASASTYATNASESAQDAALSAGSASDSADAAAVSASNAASSASNVAAIVTDVSQQAAVALASAEEAKSWAVGGTDTRAGEDTDNAKWYSIQAGASATNAAASESNAATSEANAAASESNAATSETNASSSETNAATSATNAASSETNAGASATAAALSEEKAALSRAAAATSSEDAEAWSVGTRNNVPVPSTDPAYNNNAKYWAEAAAGAAGGGVTSFNGRAGAVSSQAHDYSANQVDFNNADNGFTATNTQAAIEEVAGNLSGLDRSLASVAKSGSYNDLSNTPTLGTAAAKNSTSTISSGNTDLIESGSVYSLKQTLTNKVANEIATRAKVSGHNLLPNLLRDRTNAGITYTRNADGSVTLDGTSTGYSYTRLFDTALGDSPVTLKKGSYILSGKCGDYATLTVSLAVRIGDTAYTAFGNDEVTITLNADSVMTYATYQLGEGKTLNNLVCYPMLRLATDASSDYEPYSMTNQQITPYVQAISNPNLLDNPWFTVNQRGDTSWSSYTGYKLDRWFLDEGSGSIDDGVFTHSGSCYQKWEDSRVNTILGKTVTMSWMFPDGTIGSETTTLPSSLTSSYVWPLNNSYIAMALISNGCQIARVTAGTSLKAVKLELGSISTLAMDTAPDYATELLKCQRYFYKAMGLSAGYTLDTNLGQARIGVPVPVRMRTTPTVSMSVAGSIIDSDGGIWAISNASLNSMVGNIIDVAVTTNRTNNTILPCVNVDSQYDFSADL